jgi:hypothetical protein
MDSKEINNKINNTEDNLQSNLKPENNFYEFLLYISIYFCIGFVGILIKYFQEIFSAKKVINT